MTGSPPPDRTSRSGFKPPGRDFLRDPLQLGVTIVGTTAAFGGAGWWLDSRLHTFPVLLAVGAVLGLFGILYITYQRLRAEDDARQPPQTRPPEAP
jgi:F0F1-type ATP synthase assembly protein I